MKGPMDYSKTPRCEIKNPTGAQCKHGGPWLVNSRPVCGVHQRMISDGAKLQFIQWRQLGPEHDVMIDKQTTRAFVK